MKLKKRYLVTFYLSDAHDFLSENCAAQFANTLAECKTIIQKETERKEAYIFAQLIANIDGVTFYSDPWEGYGMLPKYVRRARVYNTKKALEILETGSDDAELLNKYYVSEGIVGYHAFDAKDKMIDMEALNYDLYLAFDADENSDPKEVWMTVKQAIKAAKKQS